MLVPNRHGTSNSYRYGFQGQEKDDELKGEGNTLNYTFRMHDPRVGRFFARDPLFRKYPYNSPYAFSENRVIDAIELEGLEAVNVGKENPYLIIIVTGRAGGAKGDKTEEGKTLHSSLPQKFKDDGLALLEKNEKQIQGEVIVYSSSDGTETIDDIVKTVKNYRETNPNGKIVMIGHSLGGKDIMVSAKMINNDTSIKNKEIHALVTIEPVTLSGMAPSDLKLKLPNNVKNIINFNGNSEGSFYGGGGSATNNGSQNVLNINMPNASHTNIDNILSDYFVPILKGIGEGKNPIELIKKQNFSKMKPKENKKNNDAGTGTTTGTID